MTQKLQSSYEIILQALNRSLDLSVHDLSLECSISEPAVRFHLRKMKEAGLVLEFDTANQEFRAGRRAHKYRITSIGYVGNLENLCRSLLKLIPESFGKNLHNVPELISEDLIGGKIQPAKPGPSALLELTGWLNLHHYRARWEAGRYGPVMHFENCPYRSIREGNDILCKVDLEILHILTGLKWEQIDWMNWENLSGECVFVVKHTS